MRRLRTHPPSRMCGGGRSRLSPQARPRYPRRVPHRRVATVRRSRFDFGTRRKLAAWTKKAAQLGAKLAARNFVRKIIFVTVHSDMRRGDLFAGKDENGKYVTVTVDDFMNFPFSAPLDELVFASTLYVLTCGHVVEFEESFTALKQSIVRLSPEYTIVFTAPEFISAFVKMFAVGHTIHVLVQGSSFLDTVFDLLNLWLDLRMHTDVLLFHVRDLLPPRAPFGSKVCAPNASNISPSPVIRYRYSWYHSHQRPWGKSLPIGCPGCCAICSWSRSKRNSKGTHPEGRVTTCLTCRYEVNSEPLQDTYEIRGDTDSGWIVYSMAL